MLAVLLSIISFMMWQIDKKKKKDPSFGVPIAVRETSLKISGSVSIAIQCKQKKNYFPTHAINAKPLRTLLFAEQCSEEFSL